MKKLFLCDIDGTILDGSRNMPNISEKTKYAIRELTKEHYVFIASGRNKRLLNKQIFDLNPNGYILCNGAYAEVDGKEIVSEFYNQETVNKIIETSLNNNGFYVLETLNRLFVNDIKAEQFIKFLSAWGTSLEGFENRPVLEGKYHIAMIGFSKEADCQKAEKELNDYVDIARHHDFLSYDLNIKGINKGLCAEKVIKYLGIDHENTYCFGDGINDLEMLQAVGHPVMMANADKRLREYHFEETDDVIDDGLYNYLVRNQLIKPIK